MADNDWLESTEGDLDPDLTEEAGYMGWEPPRRDRWLLLQRLGLAVVLISLVGGVLLVLR